MASDPIPSSTSCLPLRLIAGHINRAHWLIGLPFMVKEDRLVLRRASPWLALAMVVAVNTGGGVALFYSAIRQHGNATAAAAAYEDLAAMSKLDMLVLQMVSFMSILVMVVIASLAPRKFERLSRIFQGFGDLGIEGLGSGTYATITRLYTMSGVMIALLFVAMAVSSYAFTHSLLFRHAGYGNPMHWAILVVSALSPFFSFLNPMMYASSILSIYLYGCMTEGFKFLEELARGQLGKEDKHEAQEEELRLTRDRMARVGKKLHSLLNYLNAALSAEMLTLCGAYLLCLTTFSYTCLSSFMKKNKGLQLYVASFCVTTFLLSIIFGAVFYALCWVGQSVEDSREKAREALEDFLVEWETAGSEEEVRGQLATLASQMEAPDPVSPFSAFAVNHAGFLNTMTTSFTYLIVFLQFKVAE